MLASLCFNRRAVPAGVMDGVRALLTIDSCSSINDDNDDDERHAEKRRISSSLSEALRAPTTPTTSGTADGNATTNAPSMAIAAAGTEPARSASGATPAPAPAPAPVLSAILDPKTDQDSKTVTGEAPPTKPDDEPETNTTGEHRTNVDEILQTTADDEHQRNYNGKPQTMAKEHPEVVCVKRQTDVNESALSVFESRLNIDEREQRSSGTPCGIIATEGCSDGGENTNLSEDSSESECGGSGSDDAGPDPWGEGVGESGWGKAKGICRGGERRRSLNLIEVSLKDEVRNQRTFFPNKYLEYCCSYDKKAIVLLNTYKYLVLFEMVRYHECFFLFNIPN